MAVKTRGKQFQSDFMLNGKRVRRSFDTMAEADKFEKDTLAKAQLGLAPQPVLRLSASNVPTTIKELFEHVDKTIWSKQRAHYTTEGNCRIILKYLDPSTPIAMIRTAHIEAIISALSAGGAKPATINRKIAVLSKALREALANEWITSLPRIRHLKESRGRTRFLTEDEEKDMFKWCDWAGETDFKDLLTVLIDTGMRLGEALGLKCKDTDLKNKLVRLWHTKNGMARSIPMTQRVEIILTRRHGKALMQDVSEPGNKNLEGRIFEFDRNQAQHRWARLREHMGLAHDEQFVMHALRHTCASRLVQRGVDLYVVKEWLGHLSIIMTQRYAHLAPRQLFNAARALAQTGDKILLESVSKMVTA